MTKRNKLPVIKLLNYQKKKKTHEKKKQRQEHLEVSFKYREKSIIHFKKSKAKHNTYIYMTWIEGKFGSVQTLE